MLAKPCGRWREVHLMVATFPKQTFQSRSLHDTLDWEEVLEEALDWEEDLAMGCRGNLALGQSLDGAAAGMVGSYSSS